ncbi:unnamed protein product, partial [Anisakis simplex]|uniref:TPX2 domain-containing protein n=1 Tax=Anisakis simplex TaxID=6269 RepID=A0A0M3KJL7_ANISI
DEAPPKQRRRRHFIVTKRAFRHGATFSGLRQKVDAEEEELERAADRLSEAFRSVPSRSRLPKYLNRPQEHQAYAPFHNHGSPFAVKSLSQPRVLVPANAPDEWRLLC